MKRQPRTPMHTSALTERQRQVLELIAHGRTNFEIATALGISLETVKYHVTEILTRLDVASREEAAQRWRAERRISARLGGLVVGTAVRLAAAGVGALACAAVVATVVLSRTGEGTGTAPLTQVTARPTVRPGPTATQTTAPQPTPTPPTGPYPLGTRTGIASIDRVLDAIDSGSLAEVQATFHYFPEPCQIFGPPGSLRCDDGVPGGTPIDVMALEATDGGRLTPDEAIALGLGSELVDPASTDPRIYAVVDVRAFQEPWYRYKIVFANGQAVGVDEVGATFFPCGCQRTPADQAAVGIPAGPAKYILPPR